MRFEIADEDLSHKTTGSANEHPVSLANRLDLSGRTLLLSLMMVFFSGQSLGNCSWRIGSSRQSLKFFKWLNRPTSSFSRAGAITRFSFWAGLDQPEQPPEAKRPPRQTSVARLLDLITDLKGKLITTVGSGQVGSKDGSFVEAQLNHPQGMAFYGDILFVADTQNHLIRRIDLKVQRVTTIPGTGKQARQAFFGENRSKTLPRRLTRSPLSAEIASPWDLLIHDKTRSLNPAAWQPTENSYLLQTARAVQFAHCR